MLTLPFSTALLHAYSYSPHHPPQCFFTASESLIIFTGLTQAELCKAFWKRAVILCFHTPLYKEREQHAVQKKYTEERGVCHFNSQCEVLAVSEDQHLQKIDV